MPCAATTRSGLIGWSEGLQGEVGGLDYNGRTSRWTWGVQMETWW